MKISTVVMVLLVISAVFVIFGMMVDEANVNYSTANINTSSWQGQYDYVDQINETVSPLQDTFALIEDENVGWFTRITAGIAAIPLAVIRIPALLFSMFSSSGSLITGTMTTLGVPQAIILTILVMVLVWGIFKLVELYQRWQV